MTEVTAPIAPPELSPEDKMRAEVKKATQVTDKYIGEAMQILSSVTAKGTEAIVMWQAWKPNEFPVRAAELNTDLRDTPVNPEQQQRVDEYVEHYYINQLQSFDHYLGKNLETRSNKAVFDEELARMDKKAEQKMEFTKDEYRLLSLIPDVIVRHKSPNIPAEAFDMLGDRLHSNPDVNKAYQEAELKFLEELAAQDTDYVDMLAEKRAALGLDTTADPVQVEATTPPESESTPLRDVDPIMISRNEAIRSKADIPKLVEAPLVKAAEHLYDLNLRTVNSSANRENLTQDSPRASIYIEVNSLSEENQRIAEELAREDIHELYEDTDTGERQLRISVPLTETSTVGSVSQAMMEVTSKFQPQELVWAPIYTKDEMVKRFIQSEDDSSTYTVEQITEYTGYYFDEASGKFYLSEEIYQKTISSRAPETSENLIKKSVNTTASESFPRYVDGAQQFSLEDFETNDQLKTMVAQAQRIMAGVDKHRGTTDTYEFFADVQQRIREVGTYADPSKAAEPLYTDLQAELTAEGMSGADFLLATSYLQDKLARERNAGDKTETWNQAVKAWEGDFKQTYGDEASRRSLPDTIERDVLAGTATMSGFERKVTGNARERGDTRRQGVAFVALADNLVKVYNPRARSEWVTRNPDGTVTEFSPEGLVWRQEYHHLLGQVLRGEWDQIPASKQEVAQRLQDALEDVRRTPVQELKDSYIGFLDGDKERFDNSIARSGIALPAQSELVDMAARFATLLDRRAGYPSREKVLQQLPTTDTFYAQALSYGDATPDPATAASLGGVSGGGGGPDVAVSGMAEGAYVSGTEPTFVTESGVDVSGTDPEDPTWMNFDADIDVADLKRKGLWPDAADPAFKDKLLKKKPVEARPALVVAGYNAMKEHAAEIARDTYDGEGPIPGLLEGYWARAWNENTGVAKLTEAAKSTGAYFKDTWERWKNGKEGRFSRIYDRTFMKNHFIEKTRQRAMEEVEASGTYALSESRPIARAWAENFYWNEMTAEERKAKRDMVKGNVSFGWFRGIKNKLGIPDRALNSEAIHDITVQKLQEMAERGQIAEVNVQRAGEEALLSRFSQDADTWEDFVHESAGERLTILDNNSELAQSIRSLVAEYATNLKMSEADLTQGLQEAMIESYPDIDAEHAEDMAQAEYYASTLKELGDWYRTQAKHYEGAAAIEADLMDQEIRVGWAVPGERTSAEQTVGERAMARLERFGINPQTAAVAAGMATAMYDLTVGVATSGIGSSKLRKAATAVGLVALPFVGTSTIAPLAVGAAVAGAFTYVKTRSETSGAFRAEQRRREGGAALTVESIPPTGFFGKLRENKVIKFLLGPSQREMLNRLQAPMQTSSEMTEAVYNLLEIRPDGSTVLPNPDAQTVTKAIGLLAKTKAYIEVSDRQVGKKDGLGLIRYNERSSIGNQRAILDMAVSRLRSSLLEVAENQPDTFPEGMDPRDYMETSIRLAVRELEGTAPRQALTAAEQIVLDADPEMTVGESLAEAKRRIDRRISIYAGGKAIRKASSAVVIGGAVLEMSHARETYEAITTGAQSTHQTPLQWTLSQLKGDHFGQAGNAIPSSDIITTVKDVAGVEQAGYALPIGSSLVNDGAGHLDLVLADGSVVDNFVDAQTGAITASADVLAEHHLAITQQSVELARGVGSTVPLPNGGALELPGDNFAYDPQANTLTVTMPGLDSDHDQTAVFHSFIDPDTGSISADGRDYLEQHHFAIDAQEIVSAPAATHEVVAGYLDGDPNSPIRVSGVPANWQPVTNNGTLTGFTVPGSTISSVGPGGAMVTSTTPSVMLPVTVSSDTGTVVFSNQAVAAMRGMGIDFDPDQHITAHGTQVVRQAAGAMSQEEYAVQPEHFVAARDYVDQAPNQNTVISIHRGGWYNGEDPNVTDGLEGAMQIHMSDSGDAIEVSIANGTAVSTTGLPEVQLREMAEQGRLMVVASLGEDTVSSQVSSVARDSLALTVPMEVNAEGRLVAMVDPNSALGQLFDGTTSHAERLQVVVTSGDFDAAGRLEVLPVASVTGDGLRDIVGSQAVQVPAYQMTVPASQAHHVAIFGRPQIPVVGVAVQQQDDLTQMLFPTTIPVLVDMPASGSTRANEKQPDDDPDDIDGLKAKEKQVDALVDDLFVDTDISKLKKAEVASGTPDPVAGAAAEARLKEQERYTFTDDEVTAGGQELMKLQLAHRNLADIDDIRGTASSAGDACIPEVTAYMEMLRTGASTPREKQAIRTLILDKWRQGGWESENGPQPGSSWMRPSEARFLKQNPGNGQELITNDGWINVYELETPEPQVKLEDYPSGNPTIDKLILFLVANSDQKLTLNNGNAQEQIHLPERGKRSVMINAREKLTGTVVSTNVNNPHWKRSGNSAPSVGQQYTTPGEHALLAIDSKLHDDGTIDIYCLDPQSGTVIAVKSSDMARVNQRGAIITLGYGAFDGATTAKAVREGQE